MKNIKLLSFIGLVTLFVGCKKQAQQEKVLDKPVEVQYKVGEQAEEQTPKVAPATAPVLVLSQESYDLGNVKAGETVEKKITFKNEGKGPLLIKEAHASCGCTVPEFSKEPVEVGKEGTLTVKFTANAYNAHVTKTVTLFTNTVEGTQQFKITANIVGGKKME